MSKIVCIIQARSSSTRLPNKILLPLRGREILLRVIDRVLQTRLITDVVVATTTQPADQRIADLVAKNYSNVSVYRGSEEDVLDRYYQAAKEANADVVARITSDNPMTDPDLIDRAIREFQERPGLDYVSTTVGRHTFPRGIDAEVLPFSTLERLWKTTTEPIDREHVTIHMKRFPEKFKTRSLQNDVDLSFHRWTVDEPADYQLAVAVYDKLYPENPNFRIADIVKLFDENPDLAKMNAHVQQKNSKY